MATQIARVVPASSNRPLIKVLFILGLIVLAFWTASYFPDLVLTLIISVLLTFVLRPVVLFFEFRFGIKRALSVGIVFLLIGGIMTLIGIVFVPIIIERLKILYEGFKNFPFDQKLKEAAVGITANIPLVNPEVITQKVNEMIQSGLQSLSDLLAGAAGFIANLFIVPFITYFMLAEGDTALKKLIERVPNKYFEMTLNVLYKIQTELVGYLRGWILDSVIVGILNIIGYWAIGLEYAFLLGIITGISNLIPYVGPLIGLIPAVLISLIQFGDFRLVLPIITVTVVFIQVLDNILIQPLCFSKSVDMHPVTVIFVLIIGNSMMGIAGMLLAIPIATILKASAVETYWGLKHYRITA
jgi:predicted PurR-regulated permease PerM